MEEIKPSRKNEKRVTGLGPVPLRNAGHCGRVDQIEQFCRRCYRPFNLVYLPPASWNMIRALIRPEIKATTFDPTLVSIQSIDSRPLSVHLLWLYRLGSVVYLCTVYIIIVIIVCLFRIGFYFVFLFVSVWMIADGLLAGWLAPSFLCLAIVVYVLYVYIGGCVAVCVYVCVWCRQSAPSDWLYQYKYSYDLMIA